MQHGGDAQPCGDAQPGGDAQAGGPEREGRDANAPEQAARHDGDRPGGNRHAWDRHGGCACGAIRFRVTAPVLGVGACHCSDCRKLSGGGPNYVALVPVPALVVTRGRARLFHSRGDSGADIARAFCADCGTPLWSVPANEPFVTVKLGALDDAADLAPQMHVYTASAPAWHVIPADLPAFPAMPPPMPGGG